jgi:energy-coupling factor transport system ATP-binding protein
VIELSKLSVSYGPIPALVDVSLSVQEGECVLVTGPSGCGKSTLARVLNGLIPHSLPAAVTGEAWVDGFNVIGREAETDHVARVSQKVGAVFQNPSTQLFHLNVDDEVAFGPRNLGLSEEETAARVEWSLKAIGLMELRHCKPAHLSGGQKQRLAIAAALAMQPRVLVLDEPTASLDVPGTQQLVAVLQDLQQRLGITIIIVEHRLAEVSRLVDRALVLDQGRVIADGKSEQVFSDRASFRHLGLRRPVDVPSDQWNTLLIPNGTPPAGVQPLIELQGVSAGYKKLEVIKDINLCLYPGEFAALVGDNGAGKSTMGLVMAGLLKPSRGKLVYAGRRPRPGLDVSLLFQNPSEQLFTNCVDEEVAFAPRNYGAFDLQNHQEILSEADLGELKDRNPISLSIGQQQRTALAACLSLRPALVILDEPTLGQDWGHLERLMEFLQKLNALGTAILLITHDYKLVHRYTRRVILLEEGRVVLDGHLRQEKNTNLICEDRYE